MTERKMFIKNASKSLIHTLAAIICANVCVSFCAIFGRCRNKINAQKRCIFLCSDRVKKIFNFTNGCTIRWDESAELLISRRRDFFSFMNNIFIPTAKLTNTIFRCCPRHCNHNTYNENDAKSPGFINKICFKIALLKSKHFGLFQIVHEMQMTMFRAILGAREWFDIGKFGQLASYLKFLWRAFSICTISYDDSNLYSINENLYATIIISNN